MSEGLPSGLLRASAPVALSRWQIARLADLNRQLRSVQHDLGNLHFVSILHFIDLEQAKQWPSAKDILAEWERALNYFAAVYQHVFFPQNTPVPPPDGIHIKIRSGFTYFRVKTVMYPEGSRSGTRFFAVAEINALFKAINQLKQRLADDRVSYEDLLRVWEQNGSPSDREAIFKFLKEHPFSLGKTFDRKVLAPFKIFDSPNITVTFSPELAKADHKLVREERRLSLDGATLKDIYQIMCNAGGSVVAGCDEPATESKNLPEIKSPLKVRFDVRHVFTNLKSTKRDAVFREMVEHLARIGAIPADQTEAVVAGLIKRENSISTAMGFGVARPHTEVDGIDELVIAVGFNFCGVGFSPLVDDLPVTTVALFLYPRGKANHYWDIDHKFCRNVLPAVMANPEAKPTTPENYWSLLARDFQRWLSENAVLNVGQPPDLSG
jgi:mannitol/fructose-specific phosphotransferase system IIA component (Ntr-type)